jgi:hypothetical protein
VAQDGDVLVFDGVAVRARGDLLLVVYQLAARLHRTRWLFDRIDELVAKHPSGVLVFMVVLPTADPPDGPTREENMARLRKIGKKLRRLVTTPVGDAFTTMVVRTIMRALAIANGHARDHFVTATVADGVTRLLQAAGPETPPKSVIIADIAAMQRALGEEPIALGRAAVP